MEIRTIGSTLTKLSSMDGAPVAPQRAAPEAVGLQTARAVPGVHEQLRMGQAKPSAENVREAVKNISASLEAVPSDLQFEVDDDTGDLIVKMINRQTREVIKQIPTETVIEIAKSLNNLAGRLVSARA